MYKNMGPTNQELTGTGPRGKVEKGGGGGGQGGKQVRRKVGKKSLRGGLTN